MKNRGVTIKISLFSYAEWQGAIIFVLDLLYVLRYLSPQGLSYDLIGRTRRRFKVVFLTPNQY